MKAVPVDISRRGPVGGKIMTGRGSMSALLKALGKDPT